MKLLHLLKRELSSEAQAWVDDGIVSEDQATTILARYGAHLPDGSTRSFGYYVLLSLAALFSGLASLLLISHNWEEIPRMVRMSSLVALTVGCHGWGLQQERTGRIQAANIWYFLGCFTYGTSIFLIAQIYHLGEHFPDGIWYWALGALPFVFITRSALLAWLLAAISGLWLATEVSLGFAPVSWPLFGGTLLWYCLRVRRSWTLFLLNLVASSFWLETLVASYLGEGRFLVPVAEHLPLTLGLFTIYYALAKWMEEAPPSSYIKDYGTVLRLWCLRFGLLTLLAFSFKESWLGLIELEYTHAGLVVGWTALVAGGSLSLLWLGARKRGGDGPLREWASSLAYLAMFILIVAVSLATDEPNDEVAVALQLLGNAACIGSGVWLITRALRDSLTHYFYTGIGMILVTALLRYADLIGDYIGGSILFLFFSGVLFASARFWHRHASEGESS